MGELRPAFSKTGSITAGVALCASAEALETHGLKPMARLVTSATHSIHPHLFAEAPIEAIRKCCTKAGLQLSDIGLLGSQ